MRYLLPSRRSVFTQMTITKFSFFSLFLLLTLCCKAQAPPSLTTTGAEVVVTGTRYERPATESPQRVSVIDSAQIAQAADLSQLLNEQAGIVINGAYSNPGKDRSIFLRNGANQFTLILLDGQPLIDPSSLGGAVDLRLLSLDGIERIEILRGARSLLYGSDAVAGVINLITKKDTALDPFRLHLRAAAQSYNTLEGSAAISGSTKKLSYHLGYDYFDTEGLSEAEPAPGSGTTFGRDGATRTTLTARAKALIGKRFSLRPTLRIANFDGDYDGGSFQDGANQYTNDLLHLGLAANFEGEEIDFGLLSSYVKTDRAFNDANFGLSEFFGRAQQHDLFAVYQPTNRAAVTIGTQLRGEELERQDPGVDNLEATTLSPYLQLNLTVAEDLLFEAGYRYNNHSEFGGQNNWSLALGVNTTASWSTRLALASAFQSPTLDQLGGPFGPNAELAPQVATSVELSTQLAAPNGRYRISLTGFRRNVQDLIVYATSVEFPFGRYENQNELVDRGLELEGFVDVGKSIRANAAFSYVKGTLTQPDGNGGTTETDEFFRRPRTTGSFGLTFQAKSPFLARLSAHYTGDRPDIWFDENFISTETTLDPYWLINAYAEYRLLRQEKLKLFLDLRNLTDTDFVEVTGFSTQGVTFRTGVAIQL
ncbi:MAG: TonB-dependent receptor [Bacteroidota bacterium]